MREDDTRTEKDKMLTGADKLKEAAQLKNMERRDLSSDVLKLQMKAGKDKAKESSAEDQEGDQEQGGEGQTEMYGFIFTLHL